MSTPKGQIELAIAIAKKNQHPIVLVVDGCLISFEYIREWKRNTVDDNLLEIKGRIVSTEVKGLPPELDHWLTVERDRISACIYRDITSVSEVA